MHRTSTIVGDIADPHVAEVLDALRERDCEPAVLDAAALETMPWTWRDGRFTFGDHDVLRGRGWIRRVHPTAWGPPDASAWVDVVEAAIRTSAVAWLTTIDHLHAAENTLVQDAAARRALVRAPGTVAATSSPHLLRDRLHATRALRVVTLRERAWVCGQGPEPSTASFERVHRPEVEDDALRLARLLRVGFSSQEWVETDDGCWFAALNPSGDWLFLPEPVAGEITDALAAWLAIDDDG